MFGVCRQAQWSVLVRAGCIREVQCFQEKPTAVAKGFMFATQASIISGRWCTAQVGPRGCRRLMGFAVKSAAQQQQLQTHAHSGTAAEAVPRSSAAATSTGCAEWGVPVPSVKQHAVQASEHRQDKFDSSTA